MGPEKRRWRSVRYKLHRCLPEEDTAEFELYVLPSSGGPLTSTLLMDASLLRRYQRNKRLSPLLRLPPELRNRIWELVLTVGQINVCFKNQTHTSHTFHGPSVEIIERGFYCRILRRSQNPWRPQNAKKHNPDPPRGMTLLSPVCRQLYHETVLLPYTLNAWSFESRRVMERYILKEKRLPLPQRRAIHTLYCQALPPRHVEMCFGGLQLIVLQSGFAMAKRVVEKDAEEGGGTKAVWHVSHCQKWK